MNLQQMEYITAVDTHRHFVTAAEKCFVTQATLSMMIKKMEDELGVKIFESSKGDEGWNGKIRAKGDIVQEDVYVYKVNFIDIWGSNHSASGQVNLIK